MHSYPRLFVTLAAVLLIAACGREREVPQAGGKELQQQRTGAYLVTLLHETGQLRVGPARLILEFRRDSDRQLSDAGDVQVHAAMPMPGMPDMVVDTSVKQTAQTGRYEVQANFSMAGAYRLKITFAGGQTVEFELQVS